MVRAVQSIFGLLKLILAIVLFFGPTFGIYTHILSATKSVQVDYSGLPDSQADDSDADCDLLAKKGADAPDCLAFAPSVALALSSGKLRYLQQGFTFFPTVHLAPLEEPPKAS